MGFPVGFRFDPSDEDLISLFLLPWINGAPLPWNAIMEREMYGENAEPWKVFCDVEGVYSWYWNTKKEGGQTKKTIYVFTRLKKTTPNSNRVSRTAGCGTWSGQTGPKEIVNSTTGQIIGFTKMLSFQHSRKDDASCDSGRWIMHEYTAAGVETDIVVCKITKWCDDRRRRSK